MHLSRRAKRKCDSSFFFCWTAPSGSGSDGEPAVLLPLKSYSSAVVEGTPGIRTSNLQAGVVCDQGLTVPRRAPFPPGGKLVILLHASGVQRLLESATFLHMHTLRIYKAGSPLAAALETPSKRVLRFWGSQNSVHSTILGFPSSSARERMRTLS